MQHDEFERAWDAFCNRLYDQGHFAIKLGLENISRAFELEGHPEASSPNILVAGTNGKGETSASISRILSLKGYKVGLFTSPHLIELRERFRMDGRPCPRDEVLDVGRYLLKTYADPHDCAESGRPCLTFFELTTLMAALLFKKHHVDVAVWEVGMGGRLDATNAINPTLTIISNIGLDHQSYLGNTIEEIAAEKAGIVRFGVPVVLACQSHNEARDVIYATAGDVVDLNQPDERERSQSLDLGSSLPSAQNNRYAGLRAAEIFLGSHDPDGAHSAAAHSKNGSGMVSAIKKLTWWGRHQELNIGDTTFLLDGAHNPQGIQSLREWLSFYQIDAIFFCVMADKDLDEMFQWLGQASVPVYFVDLPMQRAASYDHLAGIVGDNLQHLPNTQAIPTTIQQHSFNTVACFGSLYFIGDLLKTLGITTDDLTL